MSIILTGLTIIFVCLLFIVSGACDKEWNIGNNKKHHRVDLEYTTQTNKITVQLDRGEITSEEAARMRQDLKKWYTQAKTKHYFDFNIPIRQFLVLALLVFGVLLVLYYPWYYLCCGFLVVECAEGPIETVLYFLLTLIPAYVFGGLIAICFGWNPGK